jgi:trehalose 6-phosphate phosphatase
MKALNPKLDLEEFFSRLHGARERVLLLDYDGTLAPFHMDPRLALPYPRACAVLREVMAAPGSRIVIVSGRRLEDLRAPLALLPHTEVWASHGWERAQGGRVARRIPAIEAREQLALAASAGRGVMRPGMRMEIKVASVALHWRGLPLAAIQSTRSAVDSAWQPLVGDELTMLPFDCGIEIRARGRDKGDAVREVLSTCGAGAVCAYLGDDCTDEDAFKAIRNRGLPVLVRGEHRRTHADLWLSHPRELTAFLERWSQHAYAA